MISNTWYSVWMVLITSAEKAIKFTRFNLKLIMETNTHLLRKLYK